MFSNSCLVVGLAQLVAALALGLLAAGADGLTIAWLYETEFVPVAEVVVFYISGAQILRTALVAAVRLTF